MSLVLEPFLPSLMRTTTVPVSPPSLFSQSGSLLTPPADDVANSWATSVSSRSISYRWAMVLGTCFEMLGAITVGARTADTIKNGIIPGSAFKGNASVQLLAFTCALAGASSWTMWCTRHSAHVSSTYSLISSVAGVGVAVAGASKVQWGWNDGKGLGAIFIGLVLAPTISAGFGSFIFLMIKFIVHLRKDPVRWAVWTSPFWFLLASSLCTLSIVYKGSPNLGLTKKPAWWKAAVIMGTGGGVGVVAAIMFLPWLHCKIIKRDATLRWYHVFLGPALWSRPYAEGEERAHVPQYAVVQHDPAMDKANGTQGARSLEGTSTPNTTKGDAVEGEKTVDNTPDMRATEMAEVPHLASYQELMAEGQERFHAKLRQGRGPLGWAMRRLHDNQFGPGAIYELHNVKTFFIRLPAYIVCGALYGSHYDIHAAQSGISGTPEGDRMERVYSYAKKYPDEVEHTYSFIQIITACTASFAHGSNDIGNSVGPFAVIYSAWKTGDPAASKVPVPIWQLAVLSGTLSIGLITYGFNIMKGEPPLILGMDNWLTEP